MAKSKIIFGNTVLIDLTGDSIKPENLDKGITAHDAAGETIVGTSTKDADTSDATMTADELLIGKTGYAHGIKKTGTMPNRGAISGVISERDQEYSIPIGFHDGGGKVGISAEEKAKLIPNNIREGINVLGVEGAMTGTEDAKPQSKEVTPGVSEQVVLPDEGYNYLSQVVVKGIPYAETENAAGGTTVTIG